ncbi:glutaredoxin domain-containing protein [Cognatilysobacter lacus]|uniref:Glutaredoxin n=1 Tax=Cognatilysobacter lacus TaxID=1643323 RepID=A0A5D8ZFS6_9GAMM|nr:glutaredoxin [Lysobacter lacus]TZF91524.1 glutaredoxin [Lysobacter lacus]
MQQDQEPTSQRATVYRMVLPDHVCPYGLKAVDLLTRNGFDVDDRHLTSREETESFKQEHGLMTTPLVVVGEERVGGADDLERWLAKRA